MRGGALVQRALHTSDSYGLLLGMLLVDYLLVALVGSRRWFGIAVTVPICLTLTLALHTSHAGTRTKTFARVAVGVTLVSSVATLASGGDPSSGGTTIFLLAALLAATPVAIVRRILAHREVRVETILGAICVYVLIGLFFTMLFIGIAIDSGSAHRFLAQPGQHGPSAYLYLSFVTLTTVGFGDLTPASNLARSLVVFEAMIGQIFLATLVARLVALFGVARTPAADDGDGGLRPVGDGDT